MLAISSPSADHQPSKDNKFFINLYVICWPQTAARGSFPATNFDGFIYISCTQREKSATEYLQLSH